MDSLGGSGLSPMEILDWVTSYNEGASSPSKRNRKTHRLDSIYYYWTAQETLPLHLARKQEYVYSDTLEIEKWYVLRNGIWVPGTFRKYRLYEDSGKLAERSIHANWQGDEEAFDTVTVCSSYFYTYNQSGLLDSFKLVKNSEILFFDLFKYNEENQLINYKRFRLDWDPSLAHEITYTYNDNSALESVVEYRGGHNREFTPSDSLVYRYDITGLLTKREDYNITENGWYLKFDFSYVHDDDNLLDSVNIISYHFRNHDSIVYEVKEDHGIYFGNRVARDAFLFVQGQFGGHIYGSHMIYDLETSSDAVKYPEALADKRALDFKLDEEGVSNAFFTHNPPQGSLAIDHEAILNTFVNEYFYTDLTLSSTSDEHLQSIRLDIYPNPSSDVVSICTAELQGKSSVLSIYNVEGGLMTTSSYLCGAAISVAHYPSGLYYIQLSAAGQQYVGSFVKE